MARVCSRNSFAIKDYAMAFALFLISIALPLLEITVLVKVGQAIGFWATLGLLVAMAVLGLAILYWQGWSTMRQVQQALLRGEAPFGPMLDGVLLVVAGVLLLTPGLITDVTALPLLISPVRRWIARWVLDKVPHAEVHVDGARRPEQQGTGPVIDGEFERLDEQPLGSKPRNDGRPQ